MAALTGFWKEKQSKFKRVLSKRQKARAARKIEKNRYKKK
jgi:hypothetical protein